MRSTDRPDGAGGLRITQLTPGTGHFHCGNCLRDVALGRAMRRLGHDVTMMPLYLPVFSEVEPPPQPPRVFLGGINVYLQHRVPLLAGLPGFVRRWLDAPGLLRWSSKRGDMVDAARHADLAVAVLRGEGGIRAGEISRLLAWLRDHDRPDVVCLCNALLTGLAGPVRRALDVPIVVTLHGEDAYLDALPEPHRATAWEVLRERARDVDAFVAVSDWYGRRMQARLGIDDARLHVVHNGVALDDIPGDAPGPAAGPPTIGYLARMCREKGLHTLVDAFIELRRRATVDDVRLEVVGVRLGADRRFVAGLETKLREAGCREVVRFHPNVTREEKHDVLRRLHVLSVPATYGEAFGLYVLEAHAFGVPVVQPEHGAFPEVIERTGGGLLCRPDDAGSLADGLERILADPALARTLGESGRRSVANHFNAERMAREVADVCTLVARPPAAPAATAGPRVSP
ncbi:MAG: glycosyltransferase family 4 protein [Planctomycetota bacterium]|jgi:glycosyltransferase involved in cell wall biosynthesis